MGVGALAATAGVNAIQGPPDPAQDRGGSAVSNPESKSPLQLKPSNVKTEVEIDTNMNYTIHEKVGDTLDYRAPEEMSFQEFAEYERKRLVQEKWEQMEKAESGSAEEDAEDLLFKFDAPGIPPVEIKPTGNVLIDFGWKWQYTENPAIPVRQQRTGGFNFDQQIKLGLAGTIGERLKVNANWDTKAAFAFDNNIKIEYQAKETDIMRSIEVGNVGFQTNSNLIKGVNKLFGIKTVMQFGRLGVTAVVATQQGKRQTMVIRGGAQTRDFEFKASQYDENRHFFLAHYFRDKFEDAFENNATNPNNGFKITRVEAYITNSNTRTENLRNILALGDLGESNVINNEGAVGVIKPGATPDNDVNDLTETLQNNPGYRDANSAVGVLQGEGFELGVDFEKINSARKLDPERDFIFHPDLGYISLTTKLRDDEALAVAFEYTIGGQTHKVGELSEDYASIGSDSVIVLKMIKPQSVKNNITTWDLMMKNVYSLNTSGVEQDNFTLRINYRDDASGQEATYLQEGENTDNIPLVQVMNLDKMNRNGDFVPDGNFDFIEDATINTRKGKIIFPVLEPFGSHLKSQFDALTEGELINRYVYSSLYEDPQSISEQVSSKNKFYVRGQYQSATSQDIRLNGFRIVEGSVQIQVGSITLTEDLDYTVNYSSGSVRITNTGVLASGGDIKISYEQEDILAFRTKSLIGTRLDYKLSEDVQLGATMMFLNEPPYYTRVSLGNEPIKNLQIGLDAKYKEESRLITKMVDLLPVIQTKEKSNIAVDWEGAMLIPGSSRQIGEGGVGYLDDFEGTETPIQLATTATSWKIGSTPRTLNLDGHTGTYSDWLEDSLGFSAHRGKLAWYSIDRTYYYPTFNDVGFDNLTPQETELNNYTRVVIPQEIFTQQSNQFGQTNQRTFDIAYFPKERGSYNYNVSTNEVKPNGLFKEPKKNWAALQRSIDNRTDFNETNVEYIEFWMMDPFQSDELEKSLPSKYLGQGANALPEEDQFDGEKMGGVIFFELGDISEDVIKDGRHGFENGLSNELNVDTTQWGRVTTQQYITGSFDNNQDRELQDIGMDGLNDEGERAFFSEYVNEVSSSGYFDQSSEFVNKFISDPSTDNFTFHNLGEDDDRILLDRYLDFNHTEGNSPESTGDLDFSQSSTTRPDNEDLNDDHTLNITDSYYRYKLEMYDKESFVSSEFITDEVETQYTGSEGTSEPITWYQVRIPIRKNLQSHSVGGINSLQTIKFVRLVLTDFEQPVVLRTTEMQLVGSQWRRWPLTINDKRDETTNVNSRDFVVSSVNIEENAELSEKELAEGVSPYAIPPGSVRDQDRSSGFQNVQQNEKSLQLCVSDLEDGHTEIAYKNGTIDILSYENIEMYMHAHRAGVIGTDDYEVSAVLRLGNDQLENYYEIEMPLKLSEAIPPGATEDEKSNLVWPSENLLDLELEELVQTKLLRDADSEFDVQAKYTREVGKYKLSVRGNPILSKIATMVLGVRNPQLPDDDGTDKSVCVWFNELRATGYRKQIGYATRGSVNMQLADLGNFRASTEISTAGWGDIESTISELQREDRINYTLSSNLAMDKFIPGKTGVKLPLYTSYDQTLIIPQFDPHQADVELEASSENKTGDEKEQFDKTSTYQKTTRDINLTNVRKEKTNAERKSRFYDVTNVTISAGYSDDRRSGIGGDDAVIGNNLDSYNSQRYNGALGYKYSFQPLKFEPFKKSKALGKSKHLKPLKEFNINFMPSNVSFTSEMNRTYTKIQLLNDQYTTDGVLPTYEKRFTFDRRYTLSWPITKSININYSANANALVDEPDGDQSGDNDISRDEYRDSVWSNILDFGRMKNYDQSIDVKYKIPINKFPVFDWTRADVGYKTSYNWIAGPIGYEDKDGLALGNEISNDRDITFNGKLDFVKLYNKSKYLKKVNRPRRKSVLTREPVQIDPDCKGDSCETKDKLILGETAVVRGLFRGLMMVRNVNGRYTISHGTFIPGFMSSPQYFGVDFDDGSEYAPGLPFIFGEQDLNYFKREASNNGWLTTSSYQNDPLMQNMKKNLSIKATLEPFSKFRINVDFKKTENTTYNEIYRMDSVSGEFQTVDSYVNGNVEMTYISFRTLFDDIGENNVSENFTNFENNRDVMRNRLLEENPELNEGDYGNYHQDVLVPAFLATYSGSNPNTASLNKVPKIPLPNWKLTYSGLTQLKPLKKRFRSVSITHGYSSKLKIPSYTSSAEYDEFYDDQFSFGTLNQDLNEDFVISDDSTGTVVPYYLLNEIAINESFSPLLGINLKTKKNVSINISYDKSRRLSLVNNQLNEQGKDELKFSFSFVRKGGGTLPFTKRWGVGGKNMKLPNDITYKINMSVADNREDQRILDGTQVTTSGNYILRIQPNIGYKYNKNLTIKIYFDYNLNTPKVSTSFKRSTTALGFTLNFKL